MKSLVKTIVTLATVTAAASANAYTDQEVGQALALCSGDYAFVAATQMKNSDQKAAKQYMDLSVAYFKTASNKIGKDAADKIAAQQLRTDAQRIQANDTTAAQEISSRVLKGCPAIGKAANVGQYL